MKNKKIFLTFFVILSLFSISNLYSQQTYRLEAPAYRIEATGDGYHRILINGYYSYAIPGYPDLPSRIFRVAVPPSIDPNSINVNYSIKKTEYLGIYNIKEIPAMRTWVDGKYITGNKADIYTEDYFFPGDCIEYMGFSQMRKWRIVAFKYTPFQYNPVSNELRFVSEVYVTIDYQTEYNSSAIEFEFHDSVMDKRAREFLLNYRESIGWYKPVRDYGPSVTYDYVIITTNAIESSSTKLGDFVTYLSSMGFSPLVITEDEYGGLTGQAPNGTAEKIRKWLQDNYTAYGIAYVLLIGNPDPDDPEDAEDSVGDVPMKMCWPRRNESSYKESPTDYFFADLTGNWDLDGDLYFGEYGDDTGTGGVDFVNEVYVGRIPVYSGVANLDSVLTKTVNYGTSSSTSWRKSALLPMSFADSTTDGAYLGEAMKNNYLTSSGYSTWTMYMQGSLCAAGDSSFSSNQELVDGATKTRWMNNDYGMVWWWGHGSTTQAYLGFEGCGWGTIMYYTDAPSLDDFHPSFVYQCSCNNGKPESAYNLGTALLYNGAIGTVSASRVSWYAVASWGTWLKYYCDNASIGYYYGYELSSNEKDAGTALYDVKSDMGVHRYSYWDGCHIMNLYDFNLYGDPSATIVERKTILVTSPDGGESWEAGSSHEITWTSTGTVGDVKIEYSTNSGGSWTDIITSTANDGIYNWTVPDDLSETCLVRVSEIGGGPLDVSDNVFTIVATPSITVISPNGGEEWAVGSSHNITWTSIGTVGNVKIEYSTNNGGSWIDVVASTDNDGSYDWTIPNAPSDNCLIRVSETDGDPTDVSDTVFFIYIPPSITVTSPNGDENWPAGSMHDITWTSTGTVGDVKIEYSINNGSSWTDIIESTINDGIFSWTVPNTQSDVCLVRVSETDGDPSDVSDAVFSIYVPPSIIVTSPNGGENWQVGSSQYITWTSSGTVGNVKIEYSISNGSSWTDIVISTPNDGSYNWIVPDNTSGNCLVRVSETDDDPSDVSDAVFSIVIPSSITVTSPNGGENWEVGSSYNITWTSTGTVGNLMIHYSFNGGNSWSNIVKSTENDGSYNWTVPDTPSGNCLVRISEKGEDSYPSDISDAVFSIISPLPTITVTSPNGRESLTMGSIHEITWIHTGTIGNVFIEYSTDSGATWKGIVNATENDGSFNWTVPENPSDHCLVRIKKSEGEGYPSDISNGAFSIIPPQEITITYPNGGETLISGLIYEITWIGSNTINNVKIEYSTNGGTSWTDIIGSTPNDGSYEWAIPNVPENPSENCLIRVSDTDGDPTDVSDTLFSIVWPSSITITSPNGGESLEAGSSHDITWTSTGTVGNVTIEYSINSGASWIPIVKSTGNNGIYNWVVPGNPSDNCQVRIRESDGDGGPWDISDAEFSITTTSYAAITVISPNGGEILYTGSTYEISWTSIGVVGNVNIEYSTNNGTSWAEIVESTSNDGLYEWTVPDDPSVDCLIRISETDGDPSPVSDDSDAAFEITTDTEPTITVTSPNGGENLTIGSTHDITWTSTGTIDNVIIEYSTDEGNAWTNIETSAVNNGSYNWTIPDTPSDHCLVRISDVDEDTGLWDVSDMVFSIAASTSATLTVTSPNRGESLVVESIHEITWTSTGEIENVKMEYSADNGTTWIEIIKSVFNNGSYEWVVPDDPSNDCLVRISGADTDDAPWDVSDVVFSIVSGTTNCGETWITANYSGSTLTFVTYASSKFAAVGNGGTIMTSSNGITWTLRSSGTNENLHGIAYGGNTFAAVGDNGVILTSPDGVTWETQPSNTSLDLRGIAYGVENFVAVGVEGVILSSSDGITWETQSAGTTNDLLGITYGVGKFVAVGNSGTILTSSDGVNWTKRSGGTTKTLNGIAYGGDQFVAVGAEGVILTSSNGTSWTSRASIMTIDFFNAVYGNSTYVIVGKDGKISTSADGIEWTSRSSGLRNDLFGIGFGNSRFVAVGAGTVLYSLCQ